MASSVQNQKLVSSIEQAWTFIQEKSNWATLIPGYLNHESTSAEEMTWVFKGDFGFIQKAVKLQLKVNEVTENSKIAFNLEGLSDNINGSGYFELISGTEGIELVGNLDMKAGGFLASMINPVLEDFVPKTVKQFVENIAQQISGETIAQ